MTAVVFVFALGMANAQCNWTVEVSSNSLGDEISWELTDAEGNAVLENDYLESTGTFTAQAEGPLEFFISTAGYFNDNDADYLIYNENGIIAMGSIDGGESATETNLNCEDEAVVSSCQGTPEAGTASIDPDTGQSGTTAHLTVSDYSETIGISALWEVKDEDGNWADAGLDGDDDMNVTFSGDNGDVLEVRYAVTCSVSGETAYSNVVSFTINNTDCIPEAVDNSDEIVNFTLADLDNDSEPSSSTDGYSDFTDSVDPANLIPGESYTAQMTSGTGTTSSHRAAIWIDYNDDGVFSEDERVALIPDGIGPNETVDFPSFEVENEPGLHRLRVQYLYNETPDPCYISTNYAETEDYMVDIQMLDACTDADAGSIVGATEMEVCAGTTFALEVDGQSDLAGGLTRTWQSSPTGENDWTSLETSSSVLEIDEITEATDYRYHVECDNGNSDNSEVVSVTLNPNPEECYCEPEGTNDNRYINSFTANDMSNVDSGFSEGGYGDFSNMIITADSGDVVEFSANIEGGSAGFRIWVDWNNDGNFDPNEEVAYQSSGYKSTHEGSFDVPSDADGEFRMRIVSHWQSTSGDVDPCETGFSYGEFEDYTINASIPDCPSVSDLEVDEESITENSATVTWDGGDADEWEVAYGEDLDEEDIDDTEIASENEYEMTGLDTDTTYNVYVRTLCDDGTSAWKSVSFSTLPPDPCDEKVTMECGVEYTADLEPNSGSWTNYTGVTYSYDGSEQVWEFTAPEDGNYEFILDEGDADADFFLMDDCSNEAGNVLGTAYWTGENDSETAELEGGVTYYLIADLYSSSPTTVSVQVNCPDSGSISYCEPQRAVQDGSGGVNPFKVDRITQVQLEDLDDTSSEDEGYVDNTEMSPFAELTQGETYTLTIEGDGNGSHYAAAWIDYDESQSFDNDELLGVFETTAPGTVEISFTVPEDAHVAQLQLRVLWQFNDDTPTQPDPCTDDDWGQTKDYTVEVSEGGETSCNAPEGLVIDNVTESSAEVTWLPGMDPGETEGWEIVYGEEGFDPDTEGESMTTQDPLATIENLDADTTYDVYVRTVCDADNGVYSDWEGPESFTVGEGGGGSQDGGESCEDPITVTDLPYDDAGNAGDYGNNYDGDDVPPEADDGIFNGTGTTNYLDGPDVVYAYTPAEDEIITISTTYTVDSGSNWGGLYVFTGCPFDLTQAYHTSTTGDAREIEHLPIDGGETYYIVVSNWYDVDFDYTIEITRLEDCAEANAGDPLETAIEICPNHTFSVSVEGNSPEANGLTRTWQTSPAGEDNWTDLNVAASTLTVDDGIEEPTDYRYHVECDNGDSDNSEVIAVTLSDDPTDCYCEAAGSTVEAITHVEFAGIDNANTNDSDGYIDYTNIVGEVTAGETYTISLEGNTSGSFTNYFTVFIDTNQDGVFDATYEIGSINGSDGNDGQAATADIEIPSSIVTGETRMRIIKNFNSSPTDPCYSPTWGQVQDYTLNVSEGDDDGGDDEDDYCQPFLDCTDGDMITNVTFEGINNDTQCSEDGYGDYTDLEANVSAGGTYTISVTVGDGWTYESVSVWIDYDNSSTFDQNEFTYVGTGSDEPLSADITIPEDVEEGSYRMRVRIAAVGEDAATWDMACDESQGFGETEDYTVNVGENAPICQAPTDIVIDNIDDHSADVAWTPGGEETQWEVIYGEMGFDPENEEGQSVMVADNPEITLENLEGDAEYDVYVRAICGEDSVSDWIGPESFLDVDRQAFESFTYYPNPVQEQLTLKANMPIESVTLFNLLGQTIMTETPNQLQTQLQTEGLQSGVYLMKVSLKGSTKTFRIVKK